MRLVELIGYSQRALHVKRWWYSRVRFVCTCTLRIIIFYLILSLSSDPVLFWEYLHYVLYADFV